MSPNIDSLIDDLESQLQHYETGDDDADVGLRVAISCLENARSDDAGMSVTVPISVMGYGHVEMSIDVDEEVTELIDDTYLTARANAFAEELSNDLYRRKRTVNK